MNGSKNLVLAACTALPMRRLEPFVASLRGTGFAGDIGLLVRDVAAETIRRLRALGVMVERSAPSAQPRMAAKASRYFSYLDFLLRHGERYANVLLIDPSDMVFEADPFATPLPADIVYTATRNRIGDTPAVHDAMVQAYGEAVAHNVRDCVLSNPDTTIATRSGMLRYLTAMTHQVAGRTGPIAGSIDQAIHNYVVHMRPLSGAWLPRTVRPCRLRKYHRRAATPCSHSISASAMRAGCICFSAACAASARRSRCTASATSTRTSWPSSAATAAPLTSCPRPSSPSRRMSRIST
jgi:hypothetical protein